MAYATTDDIQKKMQYLPFTAESRPTLTDVSDFIDQVSAEMDTIFTEAGVVTPITNATTLLMLMRICCDGVTAIIYRSINMEPEQAAALEKLYRDALRRISDSPGELGLPTVAGGPTITGFRSGADRHWEREADNW